LPFGGGLVVAHDPDDLDELAVNPFLCVAPPSVGSRIFVHVTLDCK
jgi:hypothetical protein